MVQGFQDLPGRWGTSLGVQGFQNPPGSAGDSGSIPDPGRSHMLRGNEAHAAQLLSSGTTARVRVTQRKIPRDATKPSRAATQARCSQNE